MRLKMLDIGIAPEAFQLVEFAELRLEDMDDDIEIVEENPFAIGDTFHESGKDSGLTFGNLLHIIAQRFKVCS